MKVHSPEAPDLLDLALVVLLLTLSAVALSPSYLQQMLK